MKKFIRQAAAVLLCAALLLAGAASAAAQTDPVEERLSAMSLREKVGQLFVVRIEALNTGWGASSTELTLSARIGLRQYPVGGIVLFRQNVENPDQLQALTADLQAASGTGLLVAVDEEGGNVARLANAAGFTLPKYQSAQAVGSTGDPANARAMGQTIGSYLKEYGINLDFAPVADVNTNPANPVIGKRAFSTDSVVAAQMVAAAVQGFHDAGVLCTLKHFPGHGDTAEDSHYGTATSTKTWAEMQAVEIQPFAAGITAGADVVMTAHIMTPNATQDGLPASLSYTMLTERLRGELGFTGVICTDSLSMQAIRDHFSPAEAAVMALNAGADILLMPASLPEAFDGVLQAVQSGTISEERLNESVRRILTLKQKAGLELDNRTPLQKALDAFRLGGN